MRRGYLIGAIICFVVAGLLLWALGRSYAGY